MSSRAQSRDPLVLLEDLLLCHPELDSGSQKFSAKLHKVDSKAIKKFTINTESQTKEILKDLENSKYEVKKVSQKQTKKNPLPPFTTSTLQQASNNQLGYSAKQTMRLAQQLYEGMKMSDGTHGLITYMRTDSLNLSDKFLSDAGEIIKKEYGDKLCFWGTLDEQYTLPFGSPGEVRKEVLSRINLVGEQGGLIIGPTHNIQLDTPMNNFWVYGRYHKKDLLLSNI